MSMKDFHSKLAAAQGQNPLFAALAKLRQIPDLKAILFDQDPTEWPVWTQNPDPDPTPAMV